MCTHDLRGGQTKEKKKTSPHFQLWGRSGMRREKAPTSLKHAQLRRLNVHLFALGRPYGDGQCPVALVTRSALRNGLLGGWPDGRKSPVTKPGTMWFWCNTSDGYDTRQKQATQNPTHERNIALLPCLLCFVARANCSRWFLSFSTHQTMGLPSRIVEVQACFLVCSGTVVCL